MFRWITISLCLLWSCSGTRTGNPTHGDVPVGAALAKSSVPRDPNPKLTAADAATFGTDNQAFAFDLYAELAKQPGNLFFSPYSISTAVAMAYAGAKGNTATQMASALHYTLTQPTLHVAFNATDDALDQRQSMLIESEAGGKTTGDGFQLQLVDQAWGHKDLKFIEGYLDVLAQNYGAGLFLLDFSKPDAARDIINGWVSDQTAKRIPELLPEGSLNQDTALVLTNAVYFKGSWLDKLDPAKTVSGSFHGEAGDSDVSMMHWSGEELYASSNGYQIVERAFLSPSVKMLLVLPPDGQSTDAFDASQFAALLGALNTYQVTLSLPKFKLESAKMLKAPLQDLGMHDAFDSARADFSGISETWTMIDEIYHSAFVRVDEQGVEAAAATAVVSTLLSVPEPVTVTFDRPFIFLIYDQPTGQILFLGRVTDI